ncbi:MAG: GNAT family N-acetyltransferase [Bdellovibrionales bacterium]|nr:GNAT family N-acetyltransferase [Bdellovibrionales bacterium]
MNYQIQLIENPNTSELLEIKELFLEIFDEWKESWVLGTVQCHNRVCLIKVMSADQKQVVGFKLGYAVSPRTFYSWLGGVAPTFRGQGLARETIVHLTKWCQKNGYEKITTKSMNKFKPMMILNLKMGFDIVGTEVDQDGKDQVLFEKKL